MVIYGLNLNTLELSIIFWGSWGSSENWLEPKTISKFSLPKSVKHSASVVWRTKIVGLFQGLTSLPISGFDLFRPFEHLPNDPPRGRHGLRSHPRPRGLDDSVQRRPQGVNVTNILRAAFLSESVSKLFSNYILNFKFFVERILAQKLLVKC